MKDIVTLLKAETTKDKYGDTIETTEETEVFADRKSVTRQEFYTALTGGIDAKIVFAVRVDDYADQEKLMYNGKTYYVVRTYQKGESLIELVCSDKAV